jgi:GNAT superfamily N-acetyltransferase
MMNHKRCTRSPGSCAGQGDQHVGGIRVAAAGLILRSARTADARRIVEVLRAARREFMPHAPSAHSVAEDLRWIRDELIPSSGVTVAVLEGVIVGVLAVSNKSAIGWIDQLYIRPGFERRGIGGRLLTAALATLPRPVRLYTFQESRGARRFYEAAGFKPIGFGDGTGNEERVPDVLYELR